ncbi:MAG: hypothetical protein M3N22_02750 [Acidobacteriota bacterium]|nr:hypothetical protein [Acidobacteriota bacterium]
MSRLPVASVSSAATNSLSSSAERRSRRISLDVPLVVKGELQSRQGFSENSFSLSVSAHGVLLALKTPVTIGQHVLLLNRNNWDECEGHVAYIGQPHAGLTRVGIQFTRPNPQFWSINRPPADWPQS